jgi:hypothetical protein
VSDAGPDHLLADLALAGGLLKGHHGRPDHRGDGVLVSTRLMYWMANAEQANSAAPGSVGINLRRRATTAMPAAAAPYTDRSRA